MFDDPTTLLWSVLFGGIGGGFFIYGRRQKRIIPLLSGIGLMVFPYFVTGTFSILTVGSMLMALPYFVRL